MINSQMIIKPSDSDELRGAKGCFAVDITKLCFADPLSDPWDAMCAIRKLIPNGILKLTLAGQCLVGSRHYADDIVEHFIAAAIDNGIDMLEIYDAMNDARNLELPSKAAKKYGARLALGMVYAESPAHSLPFFAGYASQLKSMGAEIISIYNMNNELTCREITAAVKGVTELPIIVSSATERIATIALDAGAIATEMYDDPTFDDRLAKRLDEIRADAGYPPLASPVSEILIDQAISSLSSSAKYEKVSADFKALIRGGFGKPPAAVSEELLRDLCGNEPLILTRPADLIAPEYDRMREIIFPWLEQEEDILTFAVFGKEAIELFERRKAMKYGLDMPHAIPELGIHIV